MKILIDINHPAHVHYFRNFIKEMDNKGHEFCVINRDSKMINDLLDYYGIKHITRNKRTKGNSTFASFINLTTMIIWCIRKSFSFRPDMYIGFGSAVCAITSKLFCKPCIVIDDTEFNSINHKLYMPNIAAVLTPFYFNKQMGDGSKQYRFNGYVEQLYLHSKDYTSNDSILKELDIRPKEYVIMRFSAYDAHHDNNINHFSEKDRIDFVNTIASKYKVLISFEQNNVPESLKQYSLNISPNKIHDLMAYAKFMVTEGATMASEAFVLGIPYLFIGSSKPLGNLDYQCKYYPDRAFRTMDKENALDVIKKLMRNSTDVSFNKKELEKHTIRPTNYLIWFVENYPMSLNMEYNDIEN